MAPKYAQQLSSAQGGMIKQCIRLGKYSYHSDLLRAMDIETIDVSVSRRTCNSKYLRLSHLSENYVSICYQSTYALAPL